MVAGVFNSILLTISLFLYLSLFILYSSIFQALSFQYYWIFNFNSNHFQSSIFVHPSILMVHLLRIIINFVLMFGLCKKRNKILIFMIVSNDVSLFCFVIFNHCVLHSIWIFCNHCPFAFLLVCCLLIFSWIISMNKINSKSFRLKFDTIIREIVIICIT